MHRVALSKIPAPAATLPRRLPWLAWVALLAIAIVGAPRDGFSQQEQEQQKQPPVDAEGWVYPKPISTWDEATKASQREAAKKLLADLNAAIARGDAHFVIAPGDYRFGEKDAPALDIKAAHDLDIEAQGATFWFNGRVLRNALTFENCRNVRLHGATLDADPFCYSQGEVRSIDAKSKTLVLRIDPGFPLPTAITPEKAGATKAVFCDPQGFFRPTMLDWVAELTPMDGRDYRVSFKNNQLFKMANDVKPGDRMVLPDRSMGHAVSIGDCEKVTLEDITIYAAPHMALVEVGGAGGNVYRRCKVVRRPGTRRLIACNADVFHSTKVGRGPLIEECEFSWSCDDIANIHSFASAVLKQTSPTEAVVVSFYRPDIAAGCELEFYDFDTMRQKGRAKVLKAIERKDLDAQARALPAEMIAEGKKVLNFFGDKCTAWEVQLDQPVTLSPHDLAFSSLQIARGAAIRKSHFHDTIGRAMLVKCEDGTIEENRVERIGLPGLMLSTDRLFWEGPFPRRIVVRGNRFSETGLAAWARMAVNGMQAAIVVRSEGRRRLFGLFAREETPISQIRIENNTFERIPITAIFMANAKDSAIVANGILQPGFLPHIPEATSELRDKSYAIYVTHSENVEIRDNTMQQPGAVTKGLIKSTSDNVRCGPQE